MDLIKETSFEICGFWFHVTWNGLNGIDTQGGKWMNPECPEPENNKLIDKLLDAYNNILPI